MDRQADVGGEYRVPSKGLKENVDCRLQNAEVKKSRAHALEERLIEFGVRIIRVAQALPKTRVGNHFAGQIIRSGTSPASNYGEAQSAESRSDFIHKMQICLKELRETRAWLLMIAKASLVKPASQLDPLLEENNQLISIFVTSIKTAKGKQVKQQTA